jgi:magnesium chelatase family protein
MITKLYSAALRGVDALEVEVEVNARGAETPAVIIVGLPDAAVRESSQRVTSAITSSALKLDLGVKTVNLAPADLKKEGPSFDLPIALAMVGASGDKIIDTDDFCVVGELGLDGAVRPVKGMGFHQRGKTHPALQPRPSRVFRKPPHLPCRFQRGQRPAPREARAGGRRRRRA